MDTFQIPRNHIFDSRSTSFLPNLMRETNNKGVDLVLNSLSGELLHASWKCVAPFGKMLEIGKRDFIGHAKLAMEIFESNRSFVGIDLAQLTLEKPEKCQKLLEQCMSYYQQDGIRPIRPVKVFEATQIIDAFRYMQKGQHIGKIVINMPESPRQLQAQPKSHEITFSANASYLLVGGLGGLGRAVSTWMVERGARQLVYISRSAGTNPEDGAFFAELEAQGCKAIAVAGDVTSEEVVKRAISLAEKPVAGIIQLSMVLRVSSHMLRTMCRPLMICRTETSYKCRMKTGKLRCHRRCMEHGTCTKHSKTQSWIFSCYLAPSLVWWVSGDNPIMPLQTPSSTLSFSIGTA